MATDPKDQKDQKTEQIELTDEKLEDVAGGLTSDSSESQAVPYPDPNKRLERS